MKLVRGNCMCCNQKKKVVDSVVKIQINVWMFASGCELLVSKKITQIEKKLLRNFCILQPFTKYFRQTVIFMWNSALRKSSTSIFQEILLVLTKFSFREVRQALGNNSICFENFLIFTNSLRFFLSLKSFGNSWDNSYIPVYY